MTDFLGTLALRGAGLAPADGRGGLAPRPRALFEPGLPGPPADAALMERADEVVAPAPVPAATQAQPPVRAQTDAVAAARTQPEETPRRHPGAPAPRPGVPTSAATPARRTATAIPLAPDDAASRPAPDPAWSAPTPPAAGTLGVPSPRATDPDTARPPAPQAVVEARPVTQAVNAPPSDGTSTVASRPAPAAPSARPLERPAEPRPPVTVSIGRIDVEVAAPSRPTAPAQRSGPERTRGFDHYARARRGRPRA